MLFFFPCERAQQSTTFNSKQRDLTFTLLSSALTEALCFVFKSNSNIKLNHLHILAWKQHCNSSANWEWLSRFRVIILAKVSITLEHVSCSLHAFSVKLAHHRGGRVGRRATYTCSRPALWTRGQKWLEIYRHVGQNAWCAHILTWVGWLLRAFLQGCRSDLGGKGGQRHVQTSSLQIRVPAKMYWYLLIWPHNICHVIAKSGNRHDFRLLKL